MKITVNSKEILKSITAVGSVIKAQNTMPILDNILFKSENGKLTLTADNLEARSTEETNTEVKESFAHCIGYDFLTKVLKGLPDTSIDLEFKKSTLVISYPNGQYDLPIFGAAEFPEKVVEDSIASIKIGGLKFANSLKSVSQFVDEKHLNTSLSGILIKVDNTGTKVVGGNGHVFFESSLDAKADEERTTIISKPVAAYFISLLDSDDEIELKFSSNNVFLSVGCKTVSAKLIDATYPDYKRLFDSLKSDKVLDVEKDAIMPALKRMLNVVDKNWSTIKMNFSANKLKLSFNNKDLAFAATESLDCHFEGDDLQIGFNANYLNTALQYSPGNPKMKFLESKSPCMIESDGCRSIIGPIGLK